jgi:hypothetical protein
MVAELEGEFLYHQMAAHQILSSLVRGSHLSITMAIGDQGGCPGSI